MFSVIFRYKTNQNARNPVSRVCIYCGKRPGFNVPRPPGATDADDR